MEDVDQQESECSLSGRIETLLDELRGTCETFLDNRELKLALHSFGFSDGGFDALQQTAAEELGKHETIEDLDLRYQMDWLCQHGQHCFAIPILLAVAYCIASQKSLAITDEGQATQLFAKARAFAEEAKNVPGNLKEKRRAIASAGGKAASNMRKRVKAKVVELLKMKGRERQRPWKYESEAIRAILPVLEKYIVENGLRRQEWERLEDKLGDWLTEDKEIMEAYKSWGNTNVSVSITMP